MTDPLPENAHQPTVLVCDPEEAFRRITVKAIEPLGCRILATGDGPSVIELAVREEPDLILLDAELPGLSGVETCQRLLEEDKLRHVPIMFLSSSHDFHARLQGLQAGAVDFMMKPFLIAELQARVTTQLRMRELLKQMVALKEEQAERLRAESLHVFAVGIGHNFNNLLTAGLGFLSLAAEQVDDPGAIGYLRNIELVMKRMCSLSGQLLAFTGDLTQQKRVVVLRRLLTNAIAIFDPVALDSGITLVCDWGGVGDHTVFCDEFRLTQAVLHVLTNARDILRATGGQIVIATQTEEDRLMVKVTDSGKGMSPEVLAHAKEPFFTTQQDVGHGLGLSMVQGVMEDLGGSLELSTIEGEGTTVCLTLPASDATSGTPDVFVGELQTDAHVLVAVDAEETRQAIQAVLVSSRLHAYPVESLESLKDVLERNADRFGVLIVDLLRAQVYGDGLMQLIRRYTQAPVVYLVSTPAEAPSAQASLQILRKPFEPEELLQTLRRFPGLVRYS